MPVRAFLTIAIFFAIIYGTSIRLPLCNAQTPTASIDQAQKKKLFQTFAELFFKGRCKDAYLMLTPLMQKGLTEEKMPVVLKQLVMRFGNFQSVNNIRVNKSVIPGMRAYKPCANLVAAVPTWRHSLVTTAKSVAFS
jgi:hypothetical protein